MNDYIDKYFWIFYLINDFDIYAFTDKKELADQFKKSRNMSLFYKKKVKLNRKEMNHLIKDYMMSELQIFEGTTYSKDRHKSVKFSIPLTMREKQIVKGISSVMLHERIFRYVWDNPYVFKNKYVKALRSIMYIQLHDSLSEDDLDMVLLNTSVDELNIILHEYKSLFIKNNEENLE